MLNSLPET